MPLIDITHPLSSRLAPWPGGLPFQLSFSARMDEGAVSNVGRYTSGIHFGTHLDAPFHFLADGLTVDQLPPERFVGPARVFDARGCGVLAPAVFAGLDGRATPRVLVRTNACDDKTVFPASIPSLAPELAPWLQAQGVTLLGLDLPSVDPVDSATMPRHRQLGAAGIIILENLDLRAADPGIYELIALPLKITGADGSPVRALLRS
jgi:arylformamidase